MQQHELEPACLGQCGLVQPAFVLMAVGRLHG